MINIRRNRNNERVDSTALQNLAMGISQSAYIGIGFVTRQNELNLVKTHIKERFKTRLSFAHIRRRARLLAKASEDQDLIEILVHRMIVGQRSDAKLSKKTNHS